MKEIPILFSTDMVKAILDGSKSQTRRIVKLKKNVTDTMFVERFNSTQFILKNPFSKNEDEIIESINKKINVGDMLWVRETWAQGFIENGTHTGSRYKADDVDFNVKWKPSLFMPKTAARIWLKCTNIRIERLKNITDNDACCEGIKVNPFGSYLNYEHNCFLGDNAIASYRSLWEKINKVGSWDTNPFVWVIEFERIERIIA